VPQKCILIVEDEAVIADGISHAFRTDGFLPHHLTLGETALALLQRPEAEQSQLIVFDVGSPDPSGFEVCRCLRQFCDVSVIFLTACNDEIDRIADLEIGADNHVTKPLPS
jgi:two-component system catabolic regulation response regulator CreB